MSLIRAGSSYIIRLMVISSLVSLSLPLSYALDIAFTSPESAEIDEVFDVSIEIDSTETFDVKVFVHMSEDSRVTRGEYISEIFNPLAESWQTSWNYVKESFPREKEYGIRVTGHSGEREICVRLRKSSATATSDKCREITITEKEQEDIGRSIVEDSEEKYKEEQREQEGYEEKQQFFSQDNSSSKDENQAFQDKDEQEVLLLAQENKIDRIMLNPLSKAEEKNKPILTKQGILRQGILYGFLVFSLIIILLIALRRL